MVRQTQVPLLAINDVEQIVSLTTCFTNNNMPVQFSANVLTVSGVSARQDADIQRFLVYLASKDTPMRFTSFARETETVDGRLILDEGAIMYGRCWQERRDIWEMGRFGSNGIHRASVGCFSFGCAQN